MSHKNKKSNTPNFSTLMKKNSQDATGCSFLEKHITRCRKWKTTNNLHSLRYYARYLFRNIDNPESYQELCDLVHSDFIPTKIQTLNTVVPALDDVNYLIQTSKNRKDYHHYGLGLRLHAKLWEQGMAQVSGGLIIFQARTGKYQEAIDNALYDRDPLDAFYLLLKILDTVDNTRADLIYEIATRLLDSVQNMENEGTRAHHIHRIVYAIKEKDIPTAQHICSDCINIAAEITDAFQSCVAHYLLTQQLATFDLDLAEEASQQVTGQTFISEEKDAILALAVIGRDREEQTKRINRLERLIKRAKKLPHSDYSQYAQITTLSLLLELFRETQSNKTLHTFANLSKIYLENTPDNDVEELMEIVFTPPPIKINQATIGYRKEDGEGEIVMGESQNLIKVLRKIGAEVPQIMQVVYNILEHFFDRIAEMEDNQPKIMEKFKSNIITLATTQHQALGTQILDFAEATFNITSGTLTSLLDSIDIAIGWYVLEVPSRSQRIYQLCSAYFDRCNVDLAELPEREEDDFSFDEEKPSEYERLKQSKEALIQKLLKSLQECPANHRQAMYTHIEGILLDNLQDLDERAARAFANIDLDFALQIIEQIERYPKRLSAAESLAKHLSQTDPEQAVKILDKFTGQSLMQAVAEDIDEICAILQPHDVSYTIWHQIYQDLKQLDTTPDQLSALRKCAIAMAKASYQESRAFFEREISASQAIDVDLDEYIPLLATCLDILDDNSKDVKGFVNYCKKNNPILDRQLRRFIEKLVVPSLSIKNPENAVDLLQVIDALEDDLSPLADTALILIQQGHNDSALGLVKKIPECLKRYPKDEQDHVLKDACQNLALCEVQHAKELEMLWDWLYGQRKTWPVILPYYLIYKAAIDPIWALAQWSETVELSEEAEALIQRAFQTDHAASLAWMLDLPDTSRKAKFISILYRIEKEKQHLPKPFRFLSHLDETEQREMIINYMDVLTEDDIALIVSAIKALEPETRLEPTRILAQNYGTEYKEQILEVVAQSIHYYEQKISEHVGEEDEAENLIWKEDDEEEDLGWDEEEEKETYDDEFGAWANIAGLVSLDIGLEILSNITDTYSKRAGIVQFFEQDTPLSVEEVCNATQDLDSWEMAWLIRDINDAYDKIDPDQAKVFLDAIRLCVNKDVRQAIEETLHCLQDTGAQKLMAQHPDFALSIIVDFENRSHQKECLEEVLESAEENCLTRWDLVAQILNAWVQQVCLTPQDLNFSLLDEITRFAPLEAFRRINRKPPSAIRTEACAHVLYHLKNKDHLCILKPVLEAQKQMFQDESDSSWRSYLKACNIFLETFKDTIGKWDVEMLDQAVPVLLPYLEPLTECSTQRNPILLDILERASLEVIDIARLLKMIDNTALLHQAGLLLSQRVQVDKLPEAMILFTGILAQQNTPKKEAACILHQILEKDLDVELDLSKKKPSNASLNFQSEVLGLLIESYESLRISIQENTSLLVAIFHLLHDTLVPEGEVYTFYNNDDDMGIDAENAGQLLGKLYQTMASPKIPQEDEIFLNLVFNGDEEFELQPLVGKDARLQGTDAGRFVSEFFKQLHTPSNSVAQSTKRCLQTMTDAYEDIENCFEDLLHMAEEAENLHKDIRYHLGSNTLRWFEDTYAEDEEGSLLPTLRIFLASELLIPADLTEYLGWVHQGMEEWMDYTLQNDISREFFESLIRISFVLGKITIHKKQDIEIPSKLNIFIQQVLLQQAEIEFSLSQGPPDMELLFQSCQQIVDDLGTLAHFSAHPNNTITPIGLQTRREKLTRDILYALRERVVSINSGEAEEEAITNDMDAFAGALWKIGLQHLGAERVEITELMCRLAESVDIDQFEDENTLFKINQQYGIELFVRSLAHTSPEEGLAFVTALNRTSGDMRDLGLFESVLLIDPEWVFINLEGFDTETKVSNKMQHLITKLEENAPEKIKEVANLIESIAENKGWIFQSGVLGALHASLAKIGEHPSKGHPDPLPEFWATAQVAADQVKHMWRIDPINALKMFNSIALEQVRHETLMDLSLSLSSVDKNVDLPAVLKATLSACETLNTPNIRFKTAQTYLPALFQISENVDKEQTLDLIHTFLELFAPASPDWLQLAYAHILPILYNHLPAETVSVFGQAIISESQA